MVDNIRTSCYGVTISVAEEGFVRMLFFSFVFLVSVACVFRTEKSVHCSGVGLVKYVLFSGSRLGRKTLLQTCGRWNPLG